MVTTAHMLVGATIGNEVRPARMALPLAFLSHYALDAVPHWNNAAIFFPSVANPYRAEAIGALGDAVLAIVLVLVVSRGRPDRRLILGSAALAAAPDADNLPVAGAWLRAWRLTAPAVSFHHAIQTNIAPSHWVMGAGPLVLIGALAWWSFRKTRIDVRDKRRTG